MNVCTVHWKGKARCALETNRRQLSIAHYLAFLSLYLYSISVFLSLFLYHYLFLSLLSPLSLALSLFVPVYQPFLLFLILRCRLVWIWARKKWPHSVQVREGDQICENKYREQMKQEENMEKGIR